MWTEEGMKLDVTDRERASEIQEEDDEESKR